MADNVAITAGSGTSIAADDISSVMYQRIKVVAGADGTATGDVAGRTVDGGSGAALYVDTRAKVVRLSATPTVSTSPAYSLKDAIGGVMTFSNAVRASGGTARIETVQVADKGQQMAPLDLVLFDRNPGSGTFTDNAAADPTDTELGYVVAVIPVGSYADFNDNSVASAPVGVSVVLNGTDLYGVMVSRGTPTYASTSDVTVTLTILQD